MRVTHSLEARILLAIREAMDQTELTQRDIAGLLNCSQSRVAKLLNGRVPLRVSDVEKLCFAVNLSPTEASRDRGLEFCAEMTPTELRTVELIRQLPRDSREGLVRFLHAHTETAIEARGVTPKRSVFGKPRTR
jgi:transcriptional regulator with XRE-family HTH domain